MSSIQHNDEPFYSQHDVEPFLDFFSFVTQTKGKHVGPNLDGAEKPYVPYPLLVQYWTVDRIYRVLSAFTPPIEVSIRLIKTDFLRTFSTLVWIGFDAVRQLSGWFINLDLGDSQLPILSRPSVWPDVLDYRTLLEKLDKHQWFFFPLHFDRNLLQDRTLSTRHILPIDFSENIARDHYIRIEHTSQGPVTRSFVSKVYHGKGADKTYENALSALRALSIKPSPNIVAYYGSFRQSGSCCLILEYVDGRALEQFFNQVNPPSTDEQVMQFWVSIFQVFYGLDRIHQLSRDRNEGYFQGIHQDIKPSNILVKKSLQGTPHEFTPKIADFSFHTNLAATKAQVYLPKPALSDRRFDAPEAAKITTAADIFSIAYLLNRSSQRVEGYFHDGIKLLSAIVDEHERVVGRCLPNDNRTSQALDLVDKYMLKASAKHRRSARNIITKFGILSLDVDQVKRHIFNLETEPISASHSELPAPATQRASNIPDSGYGSASKATAQTYHPPAVQDEGDEHEELRGADAVSVNTDNLSLDLTYDLACAFVDIFAERLFDAADSPAFDRVLRSQVVQRLPDLLRVFALRTAVTDKSPGRRIVSNFTRKNRDRITEAFESMFREEQMDERKEDDGQPDIEEDAKTFAKGEAVKEAEPDVSSKQKVLKWLSSPQLDDDLERRDPQDRTDHQETPVIQTLHDGEVDESSSETLGHKKDLSEAEMERTHSIIGSPSFSSLLAVVRNSSLFDYRNADILHAKAVLKGFNAALVLAAYLEHLVLWHFTINRDKKRFPFNDERIMLSPDIFPSDVPTKIVNATRHIVGWALKALYNIGSPQENYDIGWSSPDYPSLGCALEKFVISGGRGFLTVGAEFTLGRKDKPPMIQRHTSYVDSLNFFLSSPGIPQGHENSELGIELLLRDLNEDADALNPRAAVNFLTNRQNLERPIFRTLDELHTENRSCDRVQVLLPHEMLRGLVPTSNANQQTLSLDGAVIFGRSEMFPWRWADVGEPTGDNTAAAEVDAEDDDTISAQGSMPSSAGTFARLLGRSPNASTSAATTSMTPPTMVSSR
ncbi:hypothetical protein B0H63DRAFT_524397 [Podospora didyma]|uniref:Protein kinase domain-containing protein n=1 Tax=Podospora didyma TaxID=330526 RepID=A0AAE0NHM4_9PEZI|nr:hypothetical protein B0H63DRAFT_524397 [Podospora didyma]